MGFKAKGLKNLIGTCLAFALVQGPQHGILTLQSSINYDEGLGLTSAATAYASKCVFLLFVPLIYSSIGSKYSLLIGYLLVVVYSICNYYPSWYTLVPGAVVLGFGFNLNLINTETYCSEAATIYAKSEDETVTNSIALFLGVFGASFQLSHIMGSLISSTVLLNVDYEKYINDSDVDFKDNSTCDNIDATIVEKDYLYYVLISIYIGIGIVGFVIGATVMDSFKEDIKIGRSCLGTLPVQFKNAAVDFARMVTNWKMLLLFPLFLVDGLSIGFITGPFLKVFVSDCIGVEWIGFVSSTHSLFGVVTGITFGRLYRYIPEFILIYIGVIIGGGLSLFLIFWSREPNYIALFGFAAGWGICDGVWLSTVAGIVGSVFSDNKNTAYTVFEFGVSIGFVIIYVAGIVLPIDVQLWMIFSVIMSASVSYTLLACSTNVCYNSKKSLIDDDDEEKKLLLRSRK